MQTKNKGGIGMVTVTDHLSCAVWKWRHVTMAHGILVNVKIFKKFQEAIKDMLK
ncbi:hypothetical protein WN944_016534 [Citrus x changshan-huyou]|uniref:Uncharacterized protein n=1 Tax=Citrus x changshan-huyou TaxID=2935761 RepID=A0AAP0QKH1_9ROSI